MRELSLHILDIAQNSIVAEAGTLRIVIIEAKKEDRLTIKIKDDGRGMDEETLRRVVDPFYTTRTTRKVGLGIPMFKLNAEGCDGSFEIKSQLGVGTELIANFRISHIDRVPLGNLTDTIVTIALASPRTDLILTHCVDDKKFALSTKEIRRMLGEEVPLDNIDVIRWLREYVHENIAAIGSEAVY
jgi:hypothetical protein